MKVLEKTIMPDGTEIQLEDWRDKNTKEFPDLYGLTIGAYPVAKETGKYGLIKKGETFRLSIPTNNYSCYTSEHVKEDFEALKNGRKKLEDLCKHFHYGEKDMFYLGMCVKNVEKE